MWTWAIRSTVRNFFSLFLLDAKLRSAKPCTKPMTLAAAGISRRGPWSSWTGPAPPSKTAQTTNQCHSSQSLDDSQLQLSIHRPLSHKCYWGARVCTGEGGQAARGTWEKRYENQLLILNVCVDSTVFLSAWNFSKYIAGAYLPNTKKKRKTTSI